MTGIFEFLLANPLFLIPILLLVAMMVFAILKKLLKIAAVIAIAGVLYVVLVEYFGSGL
jgi:nicotinamide riboside transporter PnuC